MVYRILAETRKPVIEKLRQLAGERLTYTYLPRCAYVVDGIVVEKNRTIVAEETANMDIINALISEGMIEANREEDAEENIEAPDESDSQDIYISVPIEGHTGSSLRNLIYAIYARGTLISKATGGHFGASQELVEKLKEMEAPTIDSVIEAARETSGLDGIQFDSEKICLTGFPPYSDAAETGIFIQFTEAINRAALEQKRIQPKKVCKENEKYAFRTWAIRIGMGGKEYKEARKRLMRNLAGNAAFRTDAEKEKWLRKLKEKKMAERGTSA